ncbi:IPTL-CTERM sorting domain-containing protein [Candidatus Zixiibacteriota bacterium]
MKNSFCTKFFLAALLLALVAPLSSANGITINYSQSSWTEEAVTIRFENVPPGKTVTVCVFVDNGCDIRRSVVSAPAGQDGVAPVIVPQGNDPFADGDKVRASCIADGTNVCSELEDAASIIVADCGTTCESCPERSTGAPSLSQWGMIVLVLMLLAAGVIIIRRRRALAGI